MLELEVLLQIKLLLITSFYKRAGKWPPSDWGPPGAGAGAGMAGVPGRGVLPTTCCQACVGNCSAAGGWAEGMVDLFRFNRVNCYWVYLKKKKNRLGFNNFNSLFLLEKEMQLHWSNKTWTVELHPPSSEMWKQVWASPLSVKTA